MSDPEHDQYQDWLASQQLLATQEAEAEELYGIAGGIKRQLADDEHRTLMWLAQLVKEDQDRQLFNHHETPTTPHESPF